MSKKRSGSGFGASGGSASKTRKLNIMRKLKHLIKESPRLVHELVHSWNLVKLLIAVEVVINILVIKYVNYTEIDWSTYIHQVKQVFNYTNPNFNYTQIEGPTGPLVYPAGHLYIFYLLKELTEDGLNIRFAQYIYMCIYIAQLILLYKIYSYKKVIKVPPYMFLIMCLTSYRIHSIYILRLFNDPLAVLFAHASFYMLLRKRYSLSAFLFSFGVSIKMNILLYAPAYALIFYEDLGIIKSMKNAGIAAATQLVLATPFLYSDPVGYFKRAFNFGRVFLHQWTVNWRFLDEKTFASQEFFKILLAIHVILLFIMFWSRWLNVLFNRFSFNVKRDDRILTLFIANFIGVACSRSLHYQFYVWYYHSLPMILWATPYSVVAKILILGCIEFSWNEYPSTVFSSSLLHASHFSILVGLIIRQFRTSPAKQTISDQRKRKR